MNIIAVDDERLALKHLQASLKEVFSKEDIIEIFDASKDALEYADGHQISIAFLDIEMAGITGLSLASELKRKNPKVNIIFVTAYSRYSLKAMEMHASGYLLKPVSVQDIRNELVQLRYPIFRGGGVRAV